jgi:hypothetical protein
VAGSAGTSSSGLGGESGSALAGGNFGGQIAGVGGSGNQPHGGGDPAGDGGTQAGGTTSDMGDGNGGQGASPVSPSVLGGLSLWLESSPSSLEATDSRVLKWKDSSGNGNDAWEADPVRQPLLAADTLNGWPTVEFDGEPSNLTAFDRTTLQFGTEPFTVAVVAEFDNSPKPKFTQTDNLLTFTYVGYGEILTKVASGDPYDGIAIFANYPTAYNVTPTQRRLGAQLEFGTAVLVSTATNLNDGNFRLYVVQRSAPGMLEQRINGTPQGRLEIPPEIDVSAPGQNLRLGGNEVVPLRGSIAEVVMIKGPLVDANLQGLERYLMDKFRL